ncbi:MAG: Methyltransferase type 11 [Frankiales bacterium]|nr:Methyltransferase type 11 [Frankiales bacterium]
MTTPESNPTGGPATAAVVHRDADPQESARANRRWWDANAQEYYAEHGDVLGDADFLWCPEGLREADAHLLGEVAGRDVLEVGCGAAQAGRWLVSQGARVTAFDVSKGQLDQARELNQRTGIALPALVQADAQRLPFRDTAFDLVVSAFGGVPFVADSAGTMREMARVARPGGRVVFSVTHPLRWAFPDDPGPGGLTVRQSYFDRTPYVEEDEAGVAVYVEHHRTLGDRVRELVAAGLVLDDLIEPEWPAGRTQQWGQWSPLRGALVPGTAIFCAHKP